MNFEFLDGGGEIGNLEFRIDGRRRVGILKFELIKIDYRHEFD